MGHTINECILANNLCLICGSARHRASQCPHNRQVSREPTSALVGQQKLTASGLLRPMVPFQPKQPLPPQQQMYSQAHKGKGQPVGPVRGKSKVYTLTVDQADTSLEVVTGIILVHSILAYVLFDSSATHCFISSKLISKHDISCDIVHQS